MFTTAATTTDDTILESSLHKDIEASSATSPPSSPPYWIELTEKKQFSRLLYTNPVCFLCCCRSGCSPSHCSNNDRGCTGSATAETLVTDASCDDGAVSQQLEGHDINSNGQNVMVLSWLTATNNAGQFIFSIHRRRHSASILLNVTNETDVDAKSLPSNPIGNFFTLSVPIQGMEELVLAVGRISGKYVNKFASLSSYSNVSVQKEDRKQQQSHPSPSKPEYSYKKSRRTDTVEGPVIPGLNAIPIPLSLHSSESSLAAKSSLLLASPLYYINGTVAYMICEVVQILDNHHNDDHYTILGQICAAKVLSTYWDIPKNLFRPMNNHDHNKNSSHTKSFASTTSDPDSARIPPYLTFFGSQTFGYVVT